MMISARVGVARTLLTLMIALCVGSSVLSQFPAVKQTVEEWQAALTTGALDERRAAAAATLNCAPPIQRQLIPVMIELLRHESDGQIRLAVFDTLTAMGPAAAPAIPALIFAMRQDFGGRTNEERHQDYRAALALAAIGPSSVESLRNLLAAESDHLRAEAAMALGRIGKAASPAIADLIQLLDDESERVRNDATDALAAMGSEAVDLLAAAMNSETPRVRAAALTAMARSSVPSARVRNAITGALEDPDARVRAAAVRATRSSNVSQPVRETQLLSALQDPDEDVRAAAVNVLCHDTNSLENLESDITSLLHAENDSIAWNAAFLISRSGSEAVPRLLKTAHDPGSRMHHLAKAISITAGHSHSMLYEATRDDNARVRQVALLALGQIRPVSRETTDIVIASLETDDNDILLACLQSLHNLEQHANTAVPHVRKLKRHTSPRIRRQVIDILFTSAPQDEQLTTDLIELVEDPDVNVRCHAIGVLQAIGPRGALAIPAVLNHLQHDSPKLRMATVEFLASHGSAASPAVPLLRQELRSGDAEWRRAVIGALGNIGTAAQSAYQDLIDALTDESPQVREASLRGLVQLEFPFERVKSPLLHALDDAEPGVRYQAARGLRRFGNEATVLIPQLIRRSRQEQYHEETVKLLERFERYEIDPVIIDPLIELTSADQVETQRMAIRFLGLAGPTAEKALPRLASLQTHSEPSLRNEAKAAVARISGSVDSADSD